MIGDMKEDILAGKLNGLKTIGVSYGFGSRQEIVDASQNYICNSAFEIQKTLTNIG